MCYGYPDRFYSQDRYTWLHLLHQGIKAVVVVWPGRFNLEADVTTLNKSAIHLFTIGLVLF